MNLRKLFLTLLLVHWLLYQCGFLFGLLAESPLGDEFDRTWLAKVPLEIDVALAAVWFFGGILILRAFAAHRSWALLALAGYHLFFGIIIPALDPFVAFTPNIIGITNGLAYFFLGTAVSLYLFNRNDTASSPVSAG